MSEGYPSDADTPEGAEYWGQFNRYLDSRPRLPLHTVGEFAMVCRGGGPLPDYRALSLGLDPATGQPLKVEGGEQAGPGQAA